jgi:hypothetical protein
MAFPLKQVRTLEEVQNNPSEKRTDVAKQLGLPPSTLNTISAKEKIREHAYICGPGARNVWCAVCGKKCVVSWEVEVAWRTCKIVVVVMMTMKLSFTEALHVFESMRALMYAHDITERDQANIVNIESLLFSLKWKGSTKQMTINDFLNK